MSDENQKSVPSSNTPQDTGSSGNDFESTALFQNASSQAAGEVEIQPLSTPLPEYFGRYRRVSFIGRGGFGEVWRAFDPDLECYVAVKTPRTDRKFPKSVIDQFLEEGRRLAELRGCRGVVTVYDTGTTEDDFSYIVSELLEGPSLGTLIRDESLSCEQSTRLIIEIAEALHGAHLKGVIHRDIKPGNILLTKAGRPIIVDFGLAVTEEEQLIELHGTVGTLSYMSPEQGSGNSQHANAQSDIYSLGVIYYRMLTGRLPFVSNNVEEYREQVLNRPPRSPRTIDDSIPAELERICLKCLEKDVKDRYTTAADLAGELRTHLDADKSSLPRNKTPWLIAFAAIFAALVAPFVWEKFQEPEQQKEIPEKKTLVKIIPPKKTPENSVEKDWLSRLGQLPKEIIWPGYRGTSTQGFEKDRNAFAVTSSKIRLYELGKLTKAGGTISVEISQPIPIGGFGIYLGYHVGQLKRDQMARFQLIWISIIQTKSGQTNFQIHRWKSVIHPGTATLIAEKELGTHRIPSLSSGTSLRLEIKVGRNGVESVKWGSTKLTNVASPGVEKSFGPEYYTNWGLFQSSGTTWFRNPSFRPHRK